MSDWRMSTLNSNLSTTQRVINRSFAPQTQTPPGRNLPGKASPLLLDERSDISDRKVATSAEDNRQETQQAILQELLATLKEEANRLDDDVWIDEAEWSDVRPLPIPDAARAAVDIQYSSEYEDTFGLLYACIEAGEQSDRALRLTEKCITLSPSHYTAWQYRFQCLVATNADMDEEWKICLAIANSNAKNYQLWNHRRKCALRMGPMNAEREMEFATSCLELDAKNYHIWAHRQVLVTNFGLWKQEWSYAQQMVTEDPRNNSAWNQRGWLLGKSFAARLKRHTSLAAQPSDQPDKALQEDPSDLQPRFLTGSIRDWLVREVHYVQGHVSGMPHNESAWNYLVGLKDIVLDVLRRDASPGAPLSDQQESEIVAALKQLSSGAFQTALDAASADTACVPARAALFKLYLAAAASPEAPADTALSRILMLLSGQRVREQARKAVQALVDALASMDPMHAGWYHAAAGRVACA